MISFRYHIVSIVSVFLALAVGVALGGGPLKGEVDNTLVEQVEADRRAKAELQAEISALRTGNQFTDSFAQAVAPGLLGQSLEGRPVTLMVLPDAEPAAVTSLAELVGVAGGSVAGTVRVDQKLLDVSNKQLVDELGSQLLDGTSDVSVSEDAGGYERMGALIARAIATDEDEGAEVDDAASSILSGLSTAELLTGDDELTERGSLVLVVTGSESSEEDSGTNSIVTSLTRAIDAETDGVVLAGPVGAARPGGMIAEIRGDAAAAEEVSTVDALGRTAAQVVAVMALAQQAEDGSGHYGAVDAADGALPGAVPAD